MAEWLKIVSIKYRASSDISMQEFDALVSKISKHLNLEVEVYDLDYVFPLVLDEVNCMCGLVLLGKNPIRECQITVMTSENKKPTDLDNFEPIHDLINELFIVEKST